MFRTQPVADGPAGPDRTCRPVGIDGIYTAHDEVRPKAGGPVGRFPDPGPLKSSKKSSPDDSYQPLVTGPVGTNEMYVINNPGRPMAGGPLGRPFSLDPMGPRVMSSLGDGNQPPCVGPVGRPLIPDQPGDQVSEPDYKWTTQTRSESESDTGAPDSVIQTESEVHTGRVNISMANGPTDSSVIPPSSDSVVQNLGERTTQTRSESESDTDAPDSVKQTGSRVQTDRGYVRMVNGPTDSSVTPPSSDSGVHSLGEQWENMSTNSMSTGSIQTVKSFYGSDTSQVDKTNPHVNRRGMFSDGMRGGTNDSMAYSNTDSQNSDIAAMSDFSDDEDEPQGEQRPRILTDCVRDESIKEELISCDQMVPDMTTPGVGSISLDPNDKDYWTKLRLLTRQAFLLDNVKLSESDYPDAVKELVIRSRLTIMKFNEGEDTPLEQCDEGRRRIIRIRSLRLACIGLSFITERRIIMIGTIISRRLCQV